MLFKHKYLINYWSKRTFYKVLVAEGREYDDYFNRRLFYHESRFNLVFQGEVFHI